MILQQDNARPHSARHTQDTLRQNDIQTLDCPAKSPDLSPIEHLWDDSGGAYAIALTSTISTREKEDAGASRSSETELISHY